MQSLLENARRILDTAVAASHAGAETSDWTFFVGPEGGLELIAGSETPLDSLTWSRGARMAWQLRHSPDGIHVEGRAGPERCHLEADSPNHSARAVLGSGRFYQLLPKA